MIYNCLLPLILAGARSAGIFNGKIARTIEARKGISGRWAKKCAGLRRDGKLVWFHVSSAGEYLQAVPVIDLLLSREDPPSIALTFYSPSGFDYHTKHDRSGKDFRFSFVEYLPFDTRKNAGFCLDSLKPDLIVYIRYDLWPNLVSEAHGRGIPQILLSGNAPRSLARRIDSRFGIRRGMYSEMTSIGAVSERDAKWFEAATGGRVPTESTGDIRFDQVIDRVSRPGARSAAIAGSGVARFIIAGSTWPRDESVVIPGFRELLKGHPDARLVIAPHEPTGERVSGIMRALASHGLTHACLSDQDGNRTFGEDVLIADGVGYLAELYGTGVLAYVGGGFTSGVHNILEPAVLGLPVLFGPRTGNAWEASRLAALGAASTVTSPGLFALEAGRFLGDGELLRAAGEAARKFVADHAGAARRAAAMIGRFL
jgi:3-deoxy-D-manno-octulosonic-acid transferase